MRSDKQVDIVIVGAGLSGIGAARHLTQACPGKRFLILEAREAIGGTWDLFRYPGIRSDSDMYTLGYSFKPWRGRHAIADGASIKRYIEEAADEGGIRQHIRFGHRVTGASWSSEVGRWTLDVSHDGHAEQVSCQFLIMCSGYYRYEAGFTPAFPGRERFAGQVVHPQHWPEDLDYADKRIVVIGSGATAVTLAPNLAKTASQVVMLQRSATYMVSRPAADPVANVLRKVAKDEMAYRLTRWKNRSLQRLFYDRARRSPKLVRGWLLGRLRDKIGHETVAAHFTPSYDPWDQRVCLVPDDDLFDAINAGKVEVVTDQIDTFTECGIKLESGRELCADIIITATGLEMQMIGGMAVTVDGAPLELSEHVSYRGIMLNDVPNLSFTFGYVNASWTLRADLVSTFLCRLLNHMDDTGMRVCVPRLRDEDRDMDRRSWFGHFSPGYVTRAADRLPSQGDREPWLHRQDYVVERKLLEQASFDDGVLRFT